MSLEKIREQVENELREAENLSDAINRLKEVIFDMSPMKHNPVDLVRWVPLEKVQANDYNPNKVAKVEMGLLHTSVDHDGYTQPIVTVYDPEKDKYTIVDGFHRYYIEKAFSDIYERNQGRVPIVVIDKNANDRMASTVRHNRARGKHTIQGMSNMVFQMLDNGWKDEDICNELGMDAEELIRLKHITGFSKLFEDHEYRKAWKSKQQLLYEKKHQSNGKKD